MSFNDLDSSHSDSLQFSLSHSLILDACNRSQDAALSLKLSRLNLSDISVQAAEGLATIGRQDPDDESIVQRLALDHNRLTTLPMEFALLSRLRYLNLKYNNFSVFPDVLTLMPSLDTLDISHNKIRRFPSQPGKLVNLRVLRLSRNKLSRLPVFLSQFRKLDVLQLDRNPLEWPPKSIIECPPNLEPTAMKEWIQSIQDWIEADSVAKKANDDSISKNHHTWEPYESDVNNSWRFPLRENGYRSTMTPHSRTISADSNISLSSIPESTNTRFSETELRGTPERPPPLRLGMLQPSSAEPSPTRSFDSYIPSHTDYEGDFNETSSDYSSVQQHSRTASYAGRLPSAPSSTMKGKKSLPDLRTAQLNIVKKGKAPMLPDRGSPLTTPNKGKYLEGLSISSPNSQRQNSDSSHASGSRAAAPVDTGSLEHSPTDHPSMAFERNSYFRRLSSLPAKAGSLPKPLICLVESARTFLFVLCQVYNAIEHYAIYAIDDRLSSVLRKVLDPASADMMQLIRSLDRFDSITRKMLPPPAVCRAVVESCRDTVAAFNKALRVLSLQLKVISASDDVRFSRWILLELYAATAEISCAWQAMFPLIDSIKPMLHGKTLLSKPPNSGNFETNPTSASVHSDPSSYPKLRMRAIDGLGPGTFSSSVGRIRTARRHAGSFSSKDVEIGKQLPSYDDVIPSMPSNFPSGVATYTPTLRNTKRQPTAPSQAANYNGSHSRNESHSSLYLHTLTSSPSIPSKGGFLDVPQSSRTQVDKEAFQAVQEAVEVAPAVWDLLENTLTDWLDSDVEVRESLERARFITRRLHDTIQVMQENESIADKKLLHEDAHSFLKAVVYLSNIVKGYGDTHSVPPILRSNMVKLTNSTEEFAILLHVSSFSPAVRSFSPMLNFSSAQSGIDDNRLGSSLSRTPRSAQPSGSFRRQASSVTDGPRSALLAQTFKIPNLR